MLRAANGSKSCRAPTTARPYNRTGFGIAALRETALTPDYSGRIPAQRTLEGSPEAPGTSVRALARLPRVGAAGLTSGSLPQTPSDAFAVRPCAAVTPPLRRLESGRRSSQ